MVNCSGLKGMDERKMLVLISRLGRIVQIQKVSHFIYFISEQFFNLIFVFGSYWRPAFVLFHKLMLHMFFL